MGKEQSKQIGEKEMIITPKSVYLEKLKQYDLSQSMVNEQRAKIIELEKVIGTMRTNEESLKSQLQEYESDPLLKRILNFKFQIAELEADINNFLNSNTPDNTAEIQKEIEQLRNTISNLSKQIQTKNLKVMPDMKTNELQRLENAIKAKSTWETESRKENFNELLKTLADIKAQTEFDITKHLNKGDKTITESRSIYNKVRQTQPIDSNYIRIKEILTKQENILLKYMLNKRDVRKAGYNIMLSNVTEEYIDNINDYNKVEAILNLFQVNYCNIKVVRVGHTSVNKANRLLKVTFPDTTTSQQILRNRHVLQNSCYSGVRIFADKYENQD